MTVVQKEMLGHDCVAQKEMLGHDGECCTETDGRS